MSIIDKISDNHKNYKLINPLTHVCPSFSIVTVEFWRKFRNQRKVIFETYKYLIVFHMNILVNKVTFLI